MSGAQLVDGGELDHIPIVEHGDVGCAAVQHGEIVAADDLGTALPDVVEKGVLDRHLGLDVDAVERLVDDDHGGVSKERSCDLGFLEHAVGIALHKIVMATRHSQTFEDVSGRTTQTWFPENRWGPQRQGVRDEFRPGEELR